MPAVCCLPLCSNHPPQHHLFKVPYKKFLKTNSDKYVWADKLERVVRSFRADAYINILFEKDQVRICDVHFQQTDIVQSKYKIYLIDL